MIRIPRVPRKGRIIVFGVLIIAAITAAYLVGGQVTSPETEALKSVHAAVEVTAKVERRSLASTLEIQGAVQAGDSVKLTASAPAGAARAVVTGNYLQAGAPVTPGMAVAAVSGRPIITLPSNVPLYRDLKDQDEGPDVARLQEALTGMGYWPGLSGKFDLGTQNAVRALYTSLDLTSPSGDGDKTEVRWEEFAQIPTDKGTMEAISPVGTVLSDETPVATVKIAPDYVIGRASIVQSEALKVGQKVDLQGPAGYTSTSSVKSIGAFQEADPQKATTAGMDIVLATPDGQAMPAPGEPVSISVKSSTDESLAVPLTAIKQDADGAFVTLSAAPEQTSPVMVRVTVTGQADGWAAIEDQPQLAVGTPVGVS